ncbi:uncharacterized protein [Typha angustifolia]|uniref:uncharacterized protein n=1 Tax=Typha angustifolia TaxID=59011 RepID=UPI003C2F2130
MQLLRFRGQMSASITSASARTPSSLHRRHRFYVIPNSWCRLRSPPLSNCPLPAVYSKKSSFAPIQKRAFSSGKNASRWRIGVYLSGESIDGSRARDLPGQLSLDSFLSAVELLCILPPTIYSIGCLVGAVLPAAAKTFHVSAGNKFFVFQYYLLVGAVVIGSLIRWRQWQRFYRVNEKGGSVDLIERIEKVEEDLRSSATIVRVLSRQLEKLGIRFRVTRKALKEPIAETAALAQKNSEATRALAMQEDILEKELGEIQKVLLAMQEQQQKQLELILAIGKAGRVLDGKRDSMLEQGRTGVASSVPEKRKTKEMKSQPGGVAGGNDRA